LEEMPFPETRWTMLAQATLNGDSAARRALDEICERYWQPVFVAVRGSGLAIEDAHDATQSFFVYILEQSTLRRAQRERGRFRSFLLTVLWRFLRGQYRKQNAMMRGGGQEIESFDTVLDEALPAEAAPLAEVLDREWAMATLERVLSKLRAEVIEMRGEPVWETLRCFLPGSTQFMAFAKAAELLGLSEGGARTEVHRLRQRCREILRREILPTVEFPGQVDEEIEHLGKILRGASVPVAGD
jgi:DNA-directed RNA polymerase specialized sigma24 family protein